MRRKSTAIFGSLTLVVTLFALAGPAHAGFPDVPEGYWASGAIKAVAEDRTWMRDFGDMEFRPEDPLLRRHMARAVVRAFATAEQTDPAITFSDLPPEDPFFPFANVAVKLGWMAAPNAQFQPDGQVLAATLDQTLVRALGLSAEIEGLDGIRTADGTALQHPPDFAYLVLAKQLGLHYNHPSSSEVRELLPHSVVRRADAAYALYRAWSALGTSKITALERYRSITLPTMTPTRHAVVEFALSYSGYPYVYAGEWHTKTPANYCCGAQLAGGFDCSGYAWWVLRQPGEGWDNTTFRPYPGWSLPERASRYMARGAKKRLTFKKTRPTDLMLFDSDGGNKWKGVDHAGIYLGKGWMIHTSGSRDGVSIEWVQDGWYREKFVWGRRIVPLQA